MENELILLSEYCEKSRVEQAFLTLLESEGLIDTEVHNNKHYLQSSQLSDLEMFTRLHYDLSINIEGIDVVNNLLKRMRGLERELSILKRQLNIESFFEDNITIEEF